MKKEMGLKELAKKYGTDKLDHGYIEYYEKYLPLNTVSLLEIGCYKGASVKMFQDYLDCLVATFDLFDENPIEDELNKRKIMTYKGDATYVKDLQEAFTEWEVIIDDASHNSYDQQFTFLYSFVALLDREGIYVIEDLHCCNDKFYWNRGIDKFEDTFLWVLQNWTHEKGFPVNKFFNGFYLNIINDLVKDVKLHDDKIAFIWKK